MAPVTWTRVEPEPPLTRPTLYTFVSNHDPARLYFKYEATRTSSVRVRTVVSENKLTSFYIVLYLHLSSQLLPYPSSTKSNFLDDDLVVPYFPAALKQLVSSVSVMLVVLPSAFRRASCARLSSSLRAIQLCCVEVSPSSSTQIVGTMFVGLVSTVST